MTRTYVALAAAVLWVVHPLNSESVSYLTERTESLMALFYLTTFYASIRAAAAPAPAPVRRGAGSRWPSPPRPWAWPPRSRW